MVSFAARPEGTSLDEVDFSPDGRFVAFNLGGGQFGQTQVFIAPTSGTGERWQISTEGGAQGAGNPMDASSTTWRRTAT